MEHCERCIGDSATVIGRNDDGTPIYQTSKEWCTEMKECSANIDWEKVFEYGRD